MPQRSPWETPRDFPRAHLPGTHPVPALHRTDGRTPTELEPKKNDDARALPEGKTRASRECRSENDVRNYFRVTVGSPVSKLVTT